MQQVRSKSIIRTISMTKEDHEMIKKIAIKEKRSFSNMLVILAEKYLEKK